MQKSKNCFELIKEEISCIQSEDLNDQLNKNYYYEAQSEENYNAKSSFKFPKCEECNGENDCLKFYNNNTRIFGKFGDDKTECKDLATNEFFLIHKIINIKYIKNICSMWNLVISNNNFNCLKCESNIFEMLYGEKTGCSEKISIYINTNDNYYSNGKGLNDY